MGIKRVVDTELWTHGNFDDFSPEDKYFMAYLLTSPYSTQLGIYEISLKYVAIHLGYSQEAVKVLLERFENQYGIIIYSEETKEVAVKNYLRHSIIKGGAPVRDCLIKEMKRVKNKDLIRQVFAHIKGREDLNDTVKNIIAEYEEKNGELHYCNEKQNDNEKENENENDNEVSYHDTLNDTFNSIISYLNQRVGANYRASTKKTRALIRARLGEGFTLEDFQAVIDKKAEEWLGNEFEQYLRPETLFGTKFESYLNANIVKPKQKQGGYQKQTKAEELNEFYAMAARWSEED